MKIHKFARWVLGGVIAHDIAGNYMRITKEQKARAKSKPQVSTGRSDEEQSQFIYDLARDLEANAED